MDIKLKSAEELYMQYHKNPYSSSPDIVVKNMLKAIKEAQRNAIEVAVQRCNKEVVADFDAQWNSVLESWDYSGVVINSSILDCKQKLFEENSL